ncbi:uncharacterized protein LOC124874004 [Girardinichthys multiradiatus]|uniref:uncharacterized protein LOC124874004 n=1 Tax=Girardinichthys multiradiatus TaxID=208333 RepID=UPI001FAB8324|nr:uncharacterized protein LOC124874004 [Girardinichthys multiradiatus]
MDFALPACTLSDGLDFWILTLFSASGFLPLPAPCLMPLALEFNPVSVPGFMPQPNHWFIQPDPAWLSSLPGIIVKRTITALCVSITVSVNSLEDLDQSAIRFQSAGRFLINCLDHFLFWILCLIPRLRRPGVKNGKADALSRIQEPSESQASGEDEFILLESVRLSVTMLELEGEIRDATKDLPIPTSCPPDRCFVPERLIPKFQLTSRRIWISRQSDFSLLDASSLTVWITSSSGFCASSPD